jgi:hypothetical protein
MGYFSELEIDYPSKLSYCEACDQPLVTAVCLWCHPAGVTSAPSPALPRCPCGHIPGSGFCRCGQPFSAVLPRVVGVGGSAVVASSLRAPSGLVALCAFPVWSVAASFARACPGLFGVVPPVIRRAGPGWVVSVPISSRW